jgi:hypothetical protein
MRDCASKAQIELLIRCFKKIKSKDFSVKLNLLFVKFDLRIAISQYVDKIDPCFAGVRNPELAACPV